MVDSQILDVRVLEMHVPGPAHRSIAPPLLREAAIHATDARPNRLGSDQVPVRLYEPVFPASTSLTKPTNEAWATLVWAHGGSFVRGDLDWPESDWVARAFAAHGVRVVAVDYVLASETVKAPAPANDVAAVLRWIESRYGGAILVGGASAGANLAAQAALVQSAAAAAGIAGSPTGLVMIYPTLHRVQREAPEISFLVGDLPEHKRFLPERIAQMYSFYLAEDAAQDAELSPTTLDDLEPIPMSATAGLASDTTVGDAGANSTPEPRTAAGTAAAASLAEITALIEQIKAAQNQSASPQMSPTDQFVDAIEVSEYPLKPVVVGELPPKQLAKLPATIIVNAEADELRASGEQFAQQLRDAGVAVRIHTEPGTVHGFMNQPEASAEAAAAAHRTIERIVSGLETTLNSAPEQRHGLG